MNYKILISSLIIISRHRNISIQCIIELLLQSILPHVINSHRYSNSCASTISVLCIIADKSQNRIKDSRTLPYSIQ